jgi:uncharacterized protein
VAGWFTVDENPVLLGSRCTTCGAVAFPKATTFCRNPACDGAEFAEQPLSREGVVWSYTGARYQPPPPYVPTSDPFEPFGIVAAELAAEGMVVLGQLSAGASIDDVTVGQRVELVVEELYRDDEHQYLVWRWSPMSDPDE